MTTRIHQREISCSSKPKDPVEHPNRDHPSRLAVFHPFHGHDCLSFQIHLGAFGGTFATLKCRRRIDCKMHRSYNTTDTNRTRKRLQSNTIFGQYNKLLNPSCWKISVQPNHDHAQQCDPLGKQCIDPRHQAALRPLLWQTSWHATHQLLGTSPLEFTASSLITRYGCGFSPQIPAPAIQWISARPRREMLKPQTKDSFILAPVFIVDTSRGDATSFTWLCGEINTWMGLQEAAITGLPLQHLASNTVPASSKVEKSLGHTGTLAPSKNRCLSVRAIKSLKLHSHFWDSGHIHQY